LESAASVQYTHSPHGSTLAVHDRATASGATVQHVTCWLTSGAFRSVNATLELAQSCAREPTTQSGSAAPHSLSRRQMKGRSKPRKLALVLVVLLRARRLKRRSTERCVLWCARSAHAGMRSQRVRARNQHSTFPTARLCALMIHSAHTTTRSPPFRVHAGIIMTFSTSIVLALGFIATAAADPCIGSRCAAKCGTELYQNESKVYPNGHFACKFVRAPLTQ